MATDQERRIYEGITRDADELEFWNELFSRIANGSYVGRDPYRTLKANYRTDLDNVEASIEQLNVDVRATTQQIQTAISQDLTAIHTDLNSGEDPNSGNTHVTTVSDFRSHVDGATSPAYGGAAFDDPLADLLAYIVEQHTL